ncbi:pyruvate kinase [Candidatus Uhrbacteria bacterium CG_4_9_14_3_um_filter_41_35]|uniref:Pyruvate kinase n=1 Tax=Candidatus Uhrbacteria bacterium CG_4_9_14_3_um_filter_41_35 TaxID=1975034 RepID=A0A2M7XED7_9BACT|nr:MAG: pyruvate kinase [Candidatus Uhrbacteria bacterium CG_4_9_14_3_um_filter_41_35]
MEEKRTKILATIGPSSSSVTMLSRMIKSGLNAARLNFSHGTHEEHQQLIKNIRSASKKIGQPIAILQDLQGPKIRLGNLPEGGVNLVEGKLISFNTGIEKYVEGEAFPVTYKQLHKDMKAGQRILMDDGILEAECVSVKGRVVTAKVVAGGILKSHKGINLPDSTISTSSFTNKDHEDLLFGLENGVDWVALSFVTSRVVVDQVRKLIRAKCKTLGTVEPKIIAKIERAEAVQNFIDILDAVDGVMLARGDLGIEIPFEQVPIIQKEFIEICRQTGKPIVVATHMLDSMTNNPRATRAEVSDVANAIIDHADAVMLSQESATGKYPNIAVQTMAMIARETEGSRLDDINFYQIHNVQDIATSIAQTLHVMAENEQIDYIVTSVTYGEVAQKINVFRPSVPIVMACPNETIARQMMIRAGIYAVVMDDNPGSFVSRMERKLRSLKMINSKNKVAYVTAGTDGEVSLIIR